MLPFLRTFALTSKHTDTTNMNARELKALGTLIGLTIGAGVLAIPYVIAQAGFFTGIFVLIVLGLFTLLMNLYLGEITLRTKGRHQLPGYIEKYLGKKAKTLMSISLLLSIYGALTAYIIGEGQAWSAMFPISPLYPMLLFFLFMGYAVWKGLAFIETMELCLNCIVIGVLVLIILLSVHAIDFSNFTGFETKNILIPYGVILFALGGAAAIPDVRVELEKNKALLKRTIILGSIIPLVLYLLFAIVVVGVTGTQTTELATIGLGTVLGPHILFLGNFFAAFAMATSFLLLALALLWVYQCDYKIKKLHAFLLTMILPLVLALSGFVHFIQILGITGAIAGGVQGILIVLAHRQAQRKSERKAEYSIRNSLPLSLALIVLYIVGILYVLL